MDDVCQCASCARVARATIDPQLRQEILDALDGDEVARDRAYEILGEGQEPQW
jgi:hypothetical protein